ncbi:MAG: hypothetical protein L0154_20325 [Chloroflexi bacterium]|nr:hypothetical protein [Chloroflexota bacterium]
MSRFSRALLATSLGLLVILSMTLVMIVQVRAQNGSDPTPTPPVEGEVEDFYAGDPVVEGDAEWTVSDFIYQSNYPEGFTASAKVESSAGEIVNASFVWSLVIGQRRNIATEYDEETGVATLNWIPDEATPPWVAVNYQWVFEDTEGNLYHTQWILGAEYEDNTRQWTRAESEDVIVFVEEGLPDNTDELVLAAMAEGRETYRIAWGELLPYKPRAILFSNRTTWNEWQVGVTNENVIGTTRDDWGATVQVVSGGNVVDMAYGTTLHEVAHLYQSENIALGVDWFNEGNATFFELNQQNDYEQFVRNMAVNGDLPPLLRGSGPSIRGNSARDGYNIGYTFFKWLVENYGLEAHHELMVLMRRGTLRNDAIEQVTGLTIDEVEREWRTWLGATGDAPTPIPTPTFFNPLLRTPEATESSN